VDIDPIINSGMFADGRNGPVSGQTEKSQRIYDISAPSELGTFLFLGLAANLCHSNRSPTCPTSWKNISGGATLLREVPLVWRRGTRGRAL
jgi:hypothetical protein